MMRNNDWVGKRNSMRQNCQMRAEMRFLDGRPPSECTIVDISASGCRVELETADEVPEDFDLFIPSRSETKIAKVRRQDGERLGVAFLKSRLDDPLVMQTLMERVARLERGYTEVRAVVAPGGVLPSGSMTAPAMAPNPLIPPADSGPLIEHRLKALGEGLQELRITVDRLASAPTQASVDNVSDRTDAAAAEIAGLKEQIASLAGAMRGMTAGTQSETPDQSSEIASMKGEMTKLSVALRNLVEQMPKSVAMSKAASGDAGSSGADNMQMARMKADIAQLRAAMEVQQGGLASPVAMAKMEEVAALRLEVSQLREATVGGITPRVVQTEVNGLKAELQHMHEAMQTLLEPGKLPAKEANEVIKMKGDIAQLRESMTEGLTNLRTDMEELAATSSARAEPTRVVAIADDVAALKDEMASLSETLREVTTRALAESPNYSADLAHMKAEMLKLSISMKEMAAELPSVRFAGEAIAAAGPDAIQWTRINGDIAQLRAAMTRGLADLRGSIDELAEATADIVAEPARTTAVISDVTSLKAEMASLAETLRGVTSQAYADAPKFSADLAHMKAEMLKLSISMKEMAAELPSVRLAASPDAPAGVDAAQLAKINIEIARLRAVIDDRKTEAAAATYSAQMDQLAQLRAEVAQLREISRLPTAAVSAASPIADDSEVTDLRASVQTLILLVSQSLNRREAA